MYMGNDKVPWYIKEVQVRVVRILYLVPGTPGINSMEACS